MKNKKLIVFDMDGVIIDVSNSYRDTVRHTTKLFFSPAPNAAQLPEPLFDLSDLAGVKQSGGLNNDWDLSFQTINLLFTLVEKPEYYEIRDSWSTYREILSRCNLSKLVKYLNSIDKPLMTLLNQHGKIADPFVNHLYNGDVGSGNIIKQIFQEIYLGEEFFRSTYNMDARIYRGEGFIQKERMLIDRSILENLASKNILAIATGRPKAEAEYPLAHFDLKGYFDTVYSLDNCLEEEKRILDEEGKDVSLSKPNPYMLDAIAKKHKDEVNGFYYVGDMPDDMVAAGCSRFGYKSIGVLISAPDKISLTDKLHRAGAHYIVDDLGDLEELIL